GDGIFSADLPANNDPASHGSYAEALSGTLLAVVQGQREGLPFRRETKTPFVFKRHLGSALIAGGAIDFGTHFCGETFNAEIPRRVRGPGGALSARLLAPEANARDGSALVELKKIATRLGSRERSAATLEGVLGQWQRAGVYGGVVEFELAGTGRARVPWT